MTKYGNFSVDDYNVFVFNQKYMALYVCLLSSWVLVRTAEGWSHVTAEACHWEIQNVIKV
jgi:hypothetical protein